MSNQIKSIFKNLQTDMENLRNILYSYSEISPEKKEEYFKVIENVEQKINKDKFSIGLLATYSSGKSTIVNALIGKEGFLPQAQKTSTGCITRISKGNKDIAILKFTENVEKIMYSYMKEYNKKTIKRYIYLYNQNLDYVKKTIEEKYNESTYEIKSAEKIEDINGGFKPIIKIAELKELLNKNLVFDTSEKNKELLNMIQNNSELLKINWKKYAEFYHLFPISFNNNIMAEDSKEESKEYKMYEKIKEILKKVDMDVLKIEISLDSLGEYVEGKFPCEIIDEIEVKLKNWKIDEKFELIDLPGLNVTNENHQRITKRMSKEINSFIIVEGKDYTEGDTRKLIEKLKEDSPDIIKHSYLIKNMAKFIQSDKHHYEENMNNFEELRQDLGIDKERTFKIEAIDVLKNEKNEFTENFDQFKKKLISDSENEMLKNFENAILKQVTPIYEELLENIDKEYNLIKLKFSSEDEQKNQRILLKKISKDEFEKHKISLKKKVNKLLSLSNPQEWKEENHDRVIKYMEKSLKNDDYYIREAKKELDIHSPLVTDLFSGYFKNLKFNIGLRNEYFNYIKTIFYTELTELLNKEYLDKEFLKYIPDRIKEKIENKIEENTLQIKERLNGVIDIILINFDEFQNRARTRFENIYTLFYRENNTEEDKKNIFESLSSDSDFMTDLNINADDFRKSILENYNIDSLDNLDNFCRIIIIKEFSLYLNGTIKKDIKKYTNAIKNNYLKDISQEIKEIFDFDNYEEEFRDNCEELNKENSEFEYNKLKDRIQKLERYKNTISELESKPWTRVS